MGQHSATGTRYASLNQDYLAVETPPWQGDPSSNTLLLAVCDGERGRERWVAVAACAHGGAAVATGTTGARQVLASFTMHRSYPDGPSRPSAL